jgi:hypothetical protein
MFPITTTGSNMMPMKMHAVAADITDAIKTAN